MPNLLHWLLTYSVVLVGAVFLLLVASQYWPGTKARHERHRLIPLQDDR
jgi:cbb3-type cytochrome oxidase subunit 3